MLTLFHRLCFADKLPWYLVPVKYFLYVILEIGMFIQSILLKGVTWFSTGVDSRDGNTVGDDRKSSKTNNC